MKLEKQFKKTLNLIANKWQFSLLSVILDGIFVLVFARLQLELLTLSTNALMSLQGIISSVSNSLNAVQMLSIDAVLMETPGFATAFSELLKIIGWYSFGIFLAWILFKGLSFAVSYYMRGKGFWKPLFRFSYVAAVYALLFIIVMVGGVSLFSHIVFSPLSFINAETLKFIMSALVLLLCYFGYLSLMLCNTKNPLKYGFLDGIKQWKSNSLLILGTFFGANVILLDSWFLWKFYIPLGILFSFLLFPYLLFCRHFIMETLHAR